MKYNLKNNPELLKEHRRKENKKYYEKNKTKILQKKKEKYKIERASKSVRDCTNP